MPDGRFVPSPTGPLHLGNLRTALLAWLFARADGSAFRLRIDDLDPVACRPEHEASAIADLAALGLDHDGPVSAGSDAARRRTRPRSTGSWPTDRAYPCYCTRREILAEVESSVSAPHGPLPAGAYPGTCRDLSARGSGRAGGRPAVGRRGGCERRGRRSRSTTGSRGRSAASSTTS